MHWSNLVSVSARSTSAGAHSLPLVQSQKWHHWQDVVARQSRCAGAALMSGAARMGLGGLRCLGIALDPANHERTQQLFSPLLPAPFIAIVVAIIRQLDLIVPW